MDPDTTGDVVMIEFNFMIGAAAAIFGVLVGVLIRRITKFLYPFEWVTGLFLGVLTALVILQPVIGAVSGWWGGQIIDSMIYAGFVAGYFTGYCIDGLRHYIMVRLRDPRVKRSKGLPLVTYDVDGRKAYAMQTQWALWERLIHKNHIFILSKTPFGTADWDEDTKYPLFPLFERKMVNVDDARVVPVTWGRDVGNDKPRKRYALLIKKAHGSQVSMEQLCFEADAVDKANEATAEAQRRYTNLLHFFKAGLPRLFANFLASTYDKAPGMAFMEATRRSEEMMEPVDDNPIRLKSEIEKELTHHTPVKDKEDSTDVTDEQGQGQEEGKGQEKG